MSTFVRHSQARQLLHNKFVVVLGGSVQRSMYKDLVLLLQRDQYLTLPQLKSKGEFSFEHDSLVEGGRLGPMTNGIEYREVRQFRSNHHLLRFYFLTRIYSPYVESILEDFRRGLKPDVIIISSCVWDITRYGLGCLEQYKENLHKFFGQIRTIVCHDCLILWSLAMPLGKKIKGGFLVPEVSHLSPTLCHDIIEANFYSSRLAEAYGLDVLDLHFHFRLSLQHRMPDGVHWDALAHRRISSLLLQHTADAWGVDLHDPLPSPRQVHQDHIGEFGHHTIRPKWPHPRPLMDLVPLQRRGQVQYQQRLFRPDRFQLIPPNSEDRVVNIRPLLLPTQLANQPAHTAGHHYEGGGFSFHPHFQADDSWMRRTRHFRSHPYPPQHPWMTPRHSAYGRARWEPSARSTNTWTVWASRHSPSSSVMSWGEHNESWEGQKKGVSRRSFSSIFGCHYTNKTH
ncbi:PC-esterase domain-containing protein 1A isoform X3 [Larimichthys crocea]|uniref:PC-esterase domain-containing protein 1A isoform X3 n=1 Tax=Larimichthys crocea TaxID=215358 RepID=UPI000F603674|nr:PC-esterase domain-containing protein 1A isoform X3 [Larimichthys crocea]